MKYIKRIENFSINEKLRLYKPRVEQMTKSFVVGIIGNDFDNQPIIKEIKDAVFAILEKHNISVVE